MCDIVAFFPLHSPMHPRTLHPPPMHPPLHPPMHPPMHPDEINTGFDIPVHGVPLERTYALAPEQMNFFGRPSTSAPLLPPLAPSTNFARPYTIENMSFSDAMKNKYVQDLFEHLSSLHKENIEINREGRELRKELDQWRKKYYELLHDPTTQLGGRRFLSL